MERSNQPPKTEDCLAEGGPVDLWFYRKERPSRSVSPETGEPQAGPASGLSNSASKESNASGEGVLISASNTESTDKVRLRRACRGLRAWRVKTELLGTTETRSFPAALTTRAKREGKSNDKKDRPRELRESDRFIVAQGNPVQSGPTCAKGATEQRSPHRQPAR